MGYRLEVQYKQAVAAMHALGPAADKEMRVAITATLAPIVETARGIAASMPSKTFPRAIVPSVTLAAPAIRVRRSVSVVGALAERDGTWRHPVFPRKGSDRSSWRWAKQTEPPAVRPAIKIQSKRIESGLKEAFTLAGKNVGFH